MPVSKSYRNDTASIAPTLYVIFAVMVIIAIVWWSLNNPARQAQAPKAGPIQNATQLPTK